jgi:hypothetical protein
METRESFHAEGRGLKGSSITIPWHTTPAHRHVVRAERKTFDIGSGIPTESKRGREMSEGSLSVPIVP